MKTEVELLSMLDKYIKERTNIIVMLKNDVLQNAPDNESEAAIMMLIAELTQDLGFIRASGFAYVNHLYNKNKDYAFLL